VNLPLLAKRLAAAALVTAFFAAPVTGAAQPAAGGVVAGTVDGTDGSPIAGAALTLQGAGNRSATSDAQGRFRFAGVPAGTYTLVITKAGFTPTQVEEVFVTDGAAITLRPVLAPSSFSSLRSIGSVSTTGSGRATINTTPASVDILSQQVFSEQNAVQVIQALNQTPGIITTPGASNSNASGTSQGSPQTTQIRGALPYETESLIDGHPVSVGLDGSFSPTLLNPALLQDVEVVKGPGSSTTEINYAINGSVNYRTLEPTRTPQENLEYGVDGFGGQFSSMQATGSLPSHVIDYAFAAATDGTPSGLNNYKVAGSALPFLYGSPPWTVNGRVVAPPSGLPIGFGASNVPYFYSTPGALQYQEPIYACCDSVSSGYHSDSELAKIRINFSQQTALTLSYLGGQAAFNDPNEDVSLLPIGNTNQSFSIFAPPPGYTGSVASGTPIPFDTLAWSNQYQAQQQDLLQAEFRTTLGADNGILARLYSGATNNYVYQSNTGATDSYEGNAWGGLYLCPAGAGVLANGNCGGPGLPTTAPTLTYFSGTPAVFSYAAVPNSADVQDHLRGYSVELDHTSGSNVYSVSYDRSYHDGEEYVDDPVGGEVGYQLYPGSSQTFSTIALRGQLVLAPTLNASIGDYFIQYASHYTDDGALTWHDASHSLNAPRLGLAWRPSSDLAVRFSAGESVAPPYIDILSSPGGAPIPNVSGAATAYLLNQNNGDLAPETAFGYDLGTDKRIDRATTLSGDVYLTSLHNLFLPTTFADGTYTPTSGADVGNTQTLYVTQTTNLAQARYEGIELALQRAPAAGFGFRLQGSLERAFTYDLPPGFYDTAVGPDTANLAVVPNVNFYGSNGFYNGTVGGRIPYAMGYGELNWRARNGSYFTIGATYYGPNNGYNLPPFAVLSAGLRIALAKDTSLTISGDNLLGAYAQPYGLYFGGVPVPLVNGMLGASTTGNYGPPTVRLSLRRHFGQ